MPVLKSAPAGERRPLVLEFADNGLLARLFGQHDVHLARIEQALGVSVSSRGNQVAITGEGNARLIARRTLRDLYKRLEAGQPLTAGDVDGAIRLAQAAEQEDPAQPPPAAPSVRTGRRLIHARSAAQGGYLEALARDELVFGLGPAGTGKTYLAVAVAVAMLLDRRVDRLVLSRPAVEAGERLGFLPGDMRDKVDPYLRPLYDALHDMMPPGEVVRRIDSGDIEIAPLAFMRGRTLANAFVILDEAQNTTTGQMKMFLTRLGENSRMVVTGDVTQIDLPTGTRSGLVEAIETLQGVDGIGFVQFGEGDVVRHPLVTRIVRAYRQRDESRRP